MPTDDAGQSGTDRRIRRPFVVAVVIWLVCLAACAASMVAYSRGVFRARVTVHGDRVVLRHRLGTGTVSVPLPARVQTGEIYRRRSHGAADHPTVVDTTEGVYLHVTAGARGSTVGCTNDTGLRKHWTGWTTAFGARAGT